MKYILVKHTVEDYDKWKRVFDEHEAARKAMGSKGGFVLRNADDANELIILLEVDDLGKAKEFMQSDDLKAVMEKAGVITEPAIYYLDEADRPSA